MCEYLHTFFKLDLRICEKTNVDWWCILEGWQSSAETRPHFNYNRGEYWFHLELVAASKQRHTHTHTVMHPYGRLLAHRLTGKHLQSGTCVILISDISAHFSLGRRLIFSGVVQHILCVASSTSSESVVGSLQPGWVPACTAAAQYSWPPAPLEGSKNSSIMI